MVKKWSRPFAPILAAAFFAIFGATAVAQTAAPAPAGWITQHATETTVRSISELSLSSSGKELVPPEGRVGPRMADWEIRTADNSRRAAVIGIPANQAQEMFKTMRSSVFTREAVRNVPSLPAGDYVVAWMVKGQRVSNVIRFTIDPKKDPSKGPGFQLVQLEPMRFGQLPELILYVTRRNEAEPSPTHIEVASANLIVDDIILQRRGLAYTGPNSPMAVGQTYRAGLQWQAFTLQPDPAKPHMVSGQLGQWKSAPVPLETGTPLADAWDKATAKLGPAPEMKVVLTGTVVGPDGTPAMNYEAVLSSNGDALYSDLSDEEGQYYFRNVPPGDYELRCAPWKMGQPAIAAQKVTIAADKSLLFNFSFPATFTISGHVTKPDGTPAEKVDVMSDWSSADGTQTYETFSVTNDKGEYTLSSPFPKATYIGIGGTGAQPSPVHNITAPTKSVDFRLVN